MDDASYFLVIRLGPMTSECEKTVTAVQQHYTGPTITPPRVARLSQFREASLVALRTLAHMCRPFDSSNPSYSYPEISVATVPFAR